MEDAIEWRGEWPGVIRWPANACGETRGEGEPGWVVAMLAAKVPFTMVIRAHGLHQLGMHTLARC